MNILLTGATGFIGKHVCDTLLARGHNVTALVRNTDNAHFISDAKLNIIRGDIIESFSINSLPGTPDAVIHLAWPNLRDYLSITHLHETLSATLKFLTKLIMAGVNKVLVSGTCFEYGLQNGCLYEEMNTYPNTPYALAKDALRRSLQMLQMQFPFCLQWARLFYIYGPGQNPKSLLPQLDAAIERGEQIFNMSGGEQLRDYLPVETVASHLVSLIEHPTYDGLINISSGSPISIRRLAENHIAACGASIKLNLGHYPYLDHEPMAFWGDATKLNRLLSGVYGLQNNAPNRAEPL